MKSIVALVRCGNYDETLVYNAVKRGIDLLGGISGIVKPGENIVLKPNLLSAVDSAKCVTTHPSVFKAAVRILQDAGTQVSYGDSPGFGNIEPHIRKSGLKAVANETGIKLADFVNGRAVSHKTALQNKQLIIANGVLDSDGLVSLSKMKTHALTRFTGAIKNQFGCVPGTLKSQYHVKLADPYQFATLLVDINTFIKPRLYIMDGIMAMEGNGPGNGKPRAMNVLLFSLDPVALDSVACKMIDLNPEYVPTSIPGEKSSLGTYHYENIEVVGDKLESFIARDFVVVRKPPEPASLGWLRGFIRNKTTARPSINKTKCTGCGMCIKVCPVGAKALKWINTGIDKRPQHNYKNCIRCYCCQEMCPSGVITVKTPFLGRMIFRK